MDDGKEWSFYRINDGDAPLDSVLLDRVGYEWGNVGSSEPAHVRVTHLAPGAHALIWRDDGDGAELRMDLSVVVRRGDREARFLFEFPKLYRKTNLLPIDGLGKPGWQEAAAG